MSFANSMDPKMFFNDLLSMFVADTKSLQVVIWFAFIPYMKTRCIDFRVTYLTLILACWLKACKTTACKVPQERVIETFSEN
jgi:hypothetical protein